MPRDKMPRLGKIIKGKTNFFGKKMAAKNKQVLTIAPTSHCGCPKEKGVEKDKEDKPIKIKIGIGADKLMGRLNEEVFWNIFKI